MEAEHMLQEHIGEIPGVQVVPAGDQVASLSQAVDHYPYGVVAL
jgi:hypothetical protein